MLAQKKAVCELVAGCPVAGCSELSPAEADSMARPPMYSTEKTRMTQ